MNKRIAPVAARSWFHFQFSLATTFALTTVAAVGFWYWYHVPFVIDEIKKSADDPFRYGSLMPVPTTYRVVGYHCRIWGGKTVQHGPYRAYDNKGTLRVEGNYQNGRKHGEFIEYHHNGAIWRRETYVNGKTQGSSIAWNATGDPVVEAGFDKGRYHGPFSFRRDNGQRDVEGNYQHGMKEGNWRWFPNGNEGGVISGQWRNDLADGRWEWHLANGELYLHAEFIDGSLQRFDPTCISRRVLEIVVQHTADSDGVMNDKFRDSTLQYTNAPLKDVLESQTCLYPTPRIDFRRVEEAGISPNLIINCNIEKEPCLIAFTKMLEPYGLGLDFRYGTFFVDTLESISSWQDSTGVRQLKDFSASDIHLDQRWNAAFYERTAEKSFGDVLALMSNRFGLTLVTSKMPASDAPEGGETVLDALVESNFFGDHLLHALGILLDQFACKASLNGDKLVVEPQ